MVRLELLWSLRDARHFTSIRADLEALREAPMGNRVWRRATDVFHQLAERGPLHHRQLGELGGRSDQELVEADLPVLHYDRDFELIPEVTGQPVRAIAPLGSL